MVGGGCGRFLREGMLECLLKGGDGQICDAISIIEDAKTIIIGYLPHPPAGQIGEEGFRAILTHPILSRLPMILETPQDSRRDDGANLEAARRLASGGE